ncbi:hypothetical protein FIBSPDRAFT_931940 [Athelia psychrophila]|uniref:Uncharacterized protein n=1 Tax=Athelia psychrophila TaxID=1759441 RepID=A0A166JIZ6_9AGAM|nr:hypothetical protein FIBSPDRAFT_931940 [Fibularhizoctonia sp. CBS 109695]
MTVSFLKPTTLKLLDMVFLVGETYTLFGSGRVGLQASSPKPRHGLAVIILRYLTYPLMKPFDAASANQLGPAFSSARVHGAPLLAQEVTLTAYCSVVALVWTWALCVPEEVEIVKRKGLSMAIVAYYVTRISFLWIGQSSTGLLFFIRIRAIYKHSKSIRYGFFVMWILVTVSPLMTLLHPAVRLLVNDALVFIAVSLHAYRNMILDTSRLSHARRFKLLIQGNGLYKVSRILLKSGQLYYGQIWTTVAVFLGLPYSQIVFMTYVPFSSTLACKVFRMVMLCDTIENPLDTLDIHEMLEVGIMGAT